MYSPSTPSFGVNIGSSCVQHGLGTTGVSIRTSRCRIVAPGVSTGVSMHVSAGGDPEGWLHPDRSGCNDIPPGAATVGRPVGSHWLSLRRVCSTMGASACDIGRYSHEVVACPVSGSAYSARPASSAMVCPDYNQARAAAYLRRALWSLKQAVGAEWLLTEQASIGLAAQPDLWVDVHQFWQSRAESQWHGHPAEARCDACQTTLTQAVALYRGDFLSGFTLPDC